MAGRTCLTAIAALLGTLAVGCGGDPEQATSTADAARTPGLPDLEQYLLQEDELMDLAPFVSPQTDTGEPVIQTDRLTR